MLWNDHAPPHFHAKYGSYEGSLVFAGAVKYNKNNRL
jgi:hypothetical protein